MKLSSAKNIPKLIRTAIRLTINELGAGRAILLLGRPGDDRPPAKGVYGLEPDTVWTGASVNVRLLQQVLRSGESILISDTRKDSRFEVGFGAKSVAVVPLRDKNKKTVGLIYADQAAAQPMNQQTLTKLTELAEEFERCLVRLSGQGGKQEESAESSTWWVPAAVLAVAIAGYIFYFG